MHQSAMFYAKAFFDVYCADGVPADFTVVEFGSQDVNGSLRAVAPGNVRYIGLDFAEGKGVDVVIDDPYEVPLPNDSADIVVTSSCFEHSEFFWLTFLEISRILKPGGFIYLNAPSNGSYHRYPVDCWRFYPDSGVALASWARRSGFEITLVESFIGNRSEEDIWNDFVAVFRKNNEQPWHKPNLIIDGIKNYTNARFRSRLVNFSELSYESGQIAALNDAVAARDANIATLNEAVAERDGQIASLSQAIVERDGRIDRILSSVSWRLTRPLRGVKRLVRGNMSGPKRPLRALWRRLPLSGAQKTGIKTALRRHLPSAERWFGASTEMASALPGATGQDATAHQQEYGQRFGFAFNQLGHDFVPLAGDYVDSERAVVKVIAFYLPQFHPIPENDQNWGRGFTEWTNVSKAVPQFVGHYQPRLPGELGFYDLRLKEIQKRQIALARQYGIYGFCYHHYWFDGKRVLEKPFQQVLDDPTLDLPFCLCWANENWTRRWDGSDEEIILAQNHSPEDDHLFFEDILPALKDPRYIRIDGRPLLIVYRPGLLPDAAATAGRWRQAAAEAGLPGLYIASAATFGFEDYESIGYDGLVQFPPHNIAAPEITARQTLLNRDFAGHVYDYDAYRENAVKSLRVKRHTFPCVMMGWDNEARKPGRGHIFAGCTPARYKSWLRRCFDFVLANNAKSERLVFVNAWNEWAEGTYLEPDRRYGYAYLHATATLLRDYYGRTGIAERIQASNARFRKRHESVLVVHWYYFDLFDELKNQLANTDALDVVMTIPEHISPEQIDAITSSIGNVYLISVKNRGRDILPFLTALPVIESYGYRYLLKVHSKKSPQRSDGARLRQNALRELLDPEKINRVLALFDSDTTAGLIAPPGTLLSLTNGDYVVNNRNHVKTCLSRLGFADAPLDFDFIVGSMFWARVDALQKLGELGLTEDDFEEELGQLDGTMAHAIERLFGHLASRAGYRMLTLDQVPAGRVADVANV